MGRYPNRRNWQRLLFACALVAAACGPADAQDGGAATAWQPPVSQSGAATSVADFERLAAAFPDSASVRRRLVNSYLEANRGADALTEAVELVRRGYVFTPAARDLLLSLEPTPEQRAILEIQAKLATPIAASRLLASVPATVRLVECVWRDPRTGDLFVSSVVSRAIYASRRGGEWHKLPLDGAGSLSGMAFDPASGLLWVASGVFEQTPDPATAFRGLIAIDPATGEEKRRVLAPATASPGDIAVGADGTVYASDPLSGALYLARPTGNRLETLLPPGTLRSPQGIAVLPGDEGIIVSDYGYGLALVDTRAAAMKRIATDLRILLDGFDGLWLSEGRLVGIQNGARPTRIAAMTLSTDATRVVAAEILERANTGWTEPVGGNVSGGELVYVATGQWDRFGEGGAPEAERPPVPTDLRVLTLEP